MAGDFDETMEDFEDRVRAEERERVLDRVYHELSASQCIHSPYEQWMETMRRRVG